MKRGAWHQFGDRSQLLALEQLQQGAGVGVVISPRDLSRERAIDLAPQYRDAGADVMIDPQFYLPDSTVGRLPSYEAIAPFRQSVSQLHKLADPHVAAFQSSMHQLSEELGVSAVIAPAVVYEAGRSDIVDLNERLFSLAQSVAENLGVPTLATVVLGSSVTASDQTCEAILSDATALPADGWYFAFESGEQRIPAAHSFILRLCKAGLTLARTGKPLFHAFAGPVSLLSPCFGAAAAGIGHSQNLWQFTRDRWQPAEGGGGGGDAPPRLFSTALWGTIIYEDEFALLSDQLRAAILTSSPFSGAVSAAPPFLPWTRWDANKHLVYLLAAHASNALKELNAENACVAVIDHLKQAIFLHSRIASEGVALADGTNTYQNPWRAALSSLIAGCGDEFELLRMVRGL
jgi:hypothetical protein